MHLLPADFVWLAIALVMAILGLFRGFSGTLAFVLALCTSALLSSLGWVYSKGYIEHVWLRGIGVLVVGLLVFGIVRIIIKRMVNGLLAQPSDAIFGFVVGVLFACVLILVWARLGIYLEYSYLASEAAKWVR